jgi:hypothetical protein
MFLERTTGSPLRIVVGMVLRTMIHQDIVNEHFQNGGDQKPGSEL